MRFSSNECCDECHECVCRHVQRDFEIKNWTIVGVPIKPTKVKTFFINIDRKINHLKTYVSSFTDFERYSKNTYVIKYVIKSVML